MTSTKNAKKSASKLEWRIYQHEGRMMDLLQESGGEVTEEVEALEAEMAKDVESMVSLALDLRGKARMMVGECKKEAERIKNVRARWERVELLSKRWLRKANELTGADAIECGTYTVRFDPPSTAGRLVQWVPELGPKTLEQLQLRDLADLVVVPNKEAIKKAIKAGEVVPGFQVEYSTEKKVVIK